MNTDYKAMAERFHVLNAWSIRRTASIDAARYYLRTQGFSATRIGEILANGGDYYELV